MDQEWINGQLPCVTSFSLNTASKRKLTIFSFLTSIRTLLVGQLTKCHLLWKRNVVCDWDSVSTGLRVHSILEVLRTLLRAPPRLLKSLPSHCSRVICPTGIAYRCNMCWISVPYDGTHNKMFSQLSPLFDRSVKWKNIFTYVASTQWCVHLSRRTVFYLWLELKTRA